MYIFFYIILIIIVVILLLNRTKTSGVIGETKIALLLKLLSKEQYKIINNIMIYSKWGTSQIDHIVISIFGIFVIETKNYKGWIFGSENQEYWTQTIYGNKYKLYNPIRQNYSHIQALKNLETLKDGTKVTLETLKEQGILKTKYDTLKVLGNGKLTKKLTVVANKFTKSAEKAIVDAGGSIEVI